MNEFVQSIADAMSSSLGAPLAVFLLSMIPIAEARFAIPFGISMGLKPFEAFGWAFLGTSIMTPILLLILIPIINALSRTKLFSKLGKFLYDKFSKKSKQLEDEGAQRSGGESGKPKFFNKRDMKRMGGTALFVAVPLPLTGVWTGSAVASIIKLGFVKGLIGVIAGNAVACAILTLIGFLFADYINYITLAFFIIAVVVVLILIIKLIIYKPDKTAATHTDGETSSETTIDKDTATSSAEPNINENHITNNSGDAASDKKE